MLFCEVALALGLFCPCDQSALVRFGRWRLSEHSLSLLLHSLHPLQPQPLLLCLYCSASTAPISRLSSRHRPRPPVASHAHIRPLVVLRLRCRLPPAPPGDPSPTNTTRCSASSSWRRAALSKASRALLGPSRPQSATLSAALLDPTSAAIGLGYHRHCRHPQLQTRPADNCPPLASQSVEPRAHHSSLLATP